MSGNLTLNESVSQLMKRALESGEWKFYRDPHGRECYFNEVTKETTRDLRLLLLQRFQLTNLSAKELSLMSGGASRSEAAEVSTSTADAAEVAALKRELEIARSTIEAYEREVTELRLAIFGPNKKTAVPSPSSKTTAERDPGTLETLKAQLKASRDLNNTLLFRVQQDREREGLCANCAAKATVPATAVDHGTLLSSASLSFPTSLKQYTAHAPDRVLSRAVAAYSPLVPGSAAPPSLGYLPATLVPQPQLHSSLRPDDPQMVTSHAPLTMKSAKAPPTHLNQSGAFVSPARGASAARTDDSRLSHFTVNSASPPPNTVAMQTPNADRYQRTLTRSGMPAALYDGGLYPLRRPEPSLGP